MSQSVPPAPHMLASEMARVRVAISRAKDDLSEGRIPNLQDLQSLVAGVCGSAVQAIRADAAATAGGNDNTGTLAATLETLLTELNDLEVEVRKRRDQIAGDE